MAAGLRGARRRGSPTDGADWLVTPRPLRGPAEVDAGLAGTVLRFLPPVAALATARSRFDGDPRLRDRPNAGLIAALRAPRASEIDDGGRGRAPFTVHGTGAVRGGAVESTPASPRQFVSGLLLAAARLRRGPRPHPRRQRAVHAARRDDGDAPSASRRRRSTATDRGWRVAPGPIAALDRVIEPDLSNAAPFLAAALVTGGTVTVRDWPDVTTQPGDQLRPAARPRWAPR